jgi:hypothetical protein
MALSFIRLNDGWNAEPNAPGESARIDGRDVLLDFAVNAFRYREFNEDDKGGLRFVNCSRFRLGSTNDEGWHRGECRFSGIAPAWGEFYAVTGDPRSTEGPDDWVVMQRDPTEKRTHFLFYFRDRTFECVADKCLVEPIQDNALFRARKAIPQVG